MSDYPTLPTGFTYGVSTAAYQIEGAVGEGGRGRSIWDTFCAEPGRIANGETGDVACDHYHRYAEDVALMRDLGIDAYRFSIAWPRIQPDGQGAANPDGLDFYDRLVDDLLAAGIRPAATLYHWDLPQTLQDTGGWLNRGTAHCLAEYATIVAERLGDRVHMWMPINEPVVVTMFGHALGIHAPGKQLGFEALPVAHHQLLGHGLAVQALRAAGATNIGIASNHQPTWPASESEADQEAAATYDTLVNAMFTDPILRGTYPNGIGDGMPGPVDDDLAVIATPLDWYGINYYQPTLVGAPGSARAPSPTSDGAALPAEIPFQLGQIADAPTTDFGWAIAPRGLTEVLTTFRDRFGDDLPPLYVTESGCSYHDVVGPDGAVHDPLRIDYHDAHLRAVADAIAAGVDVRGYFAWSLIDNFEWAAGYRERFGFVHVDFDTQRRTPKDSYRWLRDLLATRRDAPTE